MADKHSSKAFGQQLGLIEHSVVHAVYDRLVYSLHTVCPGMSAAISMQWAALVDREKTWAHVKQVALRVNEMIQNYARNEGALRQNQRIREIAMGTTSPLQTPEPVDEPPPDDAPPTDTPSRAAEGDAVGDTHNAGPVEDRDPRVRVNHVGDDGRVLYYGEGSELYGPEGQ